MDSFLNIIVVLLGYGSSSKDFTFNICHLLLHPGAWTTIQKPRVFLYTISSHGASLLNSSCYFDFCKSSVAFFIIKTLGGDPSTDGGHRGRWPVYAYTTSADFFICADRCLLWLSSIFSFTPTYLAHFFIVKGFSSSRHIYAGNKNPSLAIDQSKNSTPENFRNCKQCPKPDNLRPKKAFIPISRKSLVRNNSLSFGRLVYCTGLCWYVIPIGFLREKGLCLRN